MRKILIFLISFYQKTFGVWKGDSCKFYPSCSSYSKEVIEKYGTIKGTFLSFKRVLRCHPWQKNQVDKVD